jgi:mercuric ion transport protein
MSHDQVVTNAIDDAVTTAPRQLERRGRWWLAVSFLFCPCHLPLTLGLLASVLGGTALGGLLRDHGWVAGLVIAATWLAGTARGLTWIRRAERGELTCAVRPPG